MPSSELLTEVQKQKRVEFAEVVRKQRPPTRRSRVVYVDIDEKWFESHSHGKGIKVKLPKNRLAARFLDQAGLSK